MSDAFRLAYVLHWSFSEVSALTVRRRREFVDALERQLAFERQEIERGKR